MTVSTYTPALVGERLCHAGRTLMAMQVPGCRPAWYRSGMPAILPQGLAQEFGIDYLLHASIKVQNDQPQSADIARMDEAWSWIAVYLAGDVPAQIRHRRVMLSRSLIHPRTDRHVASFRYIGEQVGVSHTHVRVLWDSGLEWISAGLNRSGHIPASCAQSLGRIRSIGQIAAIARDTVARDLA